MSRFRTYSPGEYKGIRVSLLDLKRKAERERLIGKRIGYDLRGSCMLHFGYVTDVAWRSLEVDGGFMDLDQFEQIVVLDDQGGVA